MSVFFRRRPAPENTSLTAAARAVTDAGRRGSLTAAAHRVNRQDRSEIERIQRRRQASGWQDDAWAMYDTIGEIKYGFNLVANAISRIRLLPAVMSDEGSHATYVHDVKDLTPGLADAAVRALSRLDRNSDGTGELLRTAALNMEVTGECWLVQRPRLIGSELPEHWSIKSVNELKVSSNGEYVVTRGPNQTSQDAEVLPANAFVARMWRAHPRYYDHADSSLLGVLELCDELLMLNRMIRSVARSRINAGILAISENFSLLDDPEDDADPVRFEEEFQFAMTQPLSDESSASAVVPLLIRGPADEVKDGIHFYEVSRTVSSDLIARAREVLERILQGIDLPKDSVTGYQQLRYTNAIVMSDALYQAHIQPLTQLICNQLTEAYLRVAVQAYGFTAEQASRLVITYDASDILTDQDKSKAANDGFDRNALSYQAWRRESGFPETDAPSTDELVLKFMLSKSDFDPQTAMAMIKSIAPELMEKATKTQQAASAGPLTPSIQNILNGAPGTPPAGGGAGTGPAAAPDAGAAAAPEAPAA